MFVEINITLHPAGPSYRVSPNNRRVQQTPNNGRRATTRWPLGTLCALDLTRSSSHSPCCRAEKDLRVVWCLGSLRLFEPSRKTPTMPVGCTPFHFSLFCPLSHSPFSHSLSLSLLSLTLSISLKCTQTAWALTISLCCYCDSHSLISPRTPSCNSDVLPLFLECLLVELIFFFSFSIAGLRKGAQGERKVSLQHVLVRCAAGKGSNKDA